MEKNTFITKQECSKIFQSDLEVRIEFALRKHDRMDFVIRKCVRIH